MTPLRADPSRRGEVRLGGLYILIFDPRQLHATVEEIRVSDQQLRSVWGDAVERLVLTTQGTALHGGDPGVVPAAEGSTRGAFPNRGEKPRPSGPDPTSPG